MESKKRLNFLLSLSLLLLNLLGDTKSTCSACSVNAIQAYQLILGPVIAPKFKISRWPYKDGNVIRMVAEDDTWVRESTRPCRLK